jgi:hypothetical protein
MEFNGSVDVTTSVDIRVQEVSQLVNLPMPNWFQGVLAIKGPGEAEFSLDILVWPRRRFDITPLPEERV